MRQRMRNAIGGPVSNTDYLAIYTQHLMYMIFCIQVCREARALVNNPGNLGSKLLG